MPWMVQRNSYKKWETGRISCTNLELQIAGRVQSERLQRLFTVIYFFYLNFKRRVFVEVACFF